MSHQGHQWGCVYSSGKSRDFLSLLGWLVYLETCKLSLFGNFLCKTFIPEQNLEKYGNEATVERWHNNLKTQLPRKLTCRNLDGQCISKETIKP